MLKAEEPQMADLTTDYPHDYNYNYTDEENAIEDSGNDDYIQGIVYYLMFVFGLFGNGLVLLIIYLFEKLTTVTNLFLLNLVLSSLLFISSLPFSADNLLRSEWIWGDFMCKLKGSLYYLGFYSSVLFLSLMTFDRHLAVVYSITASQMRNRGYALSSCAAVWIISALACIKPMILHRTFLRMWDNKTYCQEFTNESDYTFIDVQMLITAGFYIQLLLFFLFPLLLIIYCYVRITITVLSSGLATKFKTVRLIFVIVLLFFTCWTPFNIVNLMHKRASNMERGWWSKWLKVTKILAHLYFCISPIFYTFVGRKFQNYFRLLMVKHFPSLKRYISISQISRNMSTRTSTPNDFSAKF